MKVAVVGANGKVGTEICQYLHLRRDISLLPVVRNLLGSAFLRHQNLECRVFDICNRSQARVGLQDVDVVVICSYVVGPGRAALRANRVMVENAVELSESASKIIYMSSIRALG